MAYTTWNPSDKSVYIALSNGDLTATRITGAGTQGVRSIFGASSGKWYWEITINDISYTNAHIGIGDSGVSVYLPPGDDPDGYTYLATGSKENNNTPVSYGDTYDDSDVISIALDLDAGKIWWAKNGVWQASGDPSAGTNEAYSGISGTFYAIMALFTVGDYLTANFGDSAFSYSVPSGFTSGFGAPSLEGSISESINVLSEFYDNLGELDENVSVSSIFNDNWSEINENIGVSSEFLVFLGSDIFDENISVNTIFLCSDTDNISEDISVDSEFISEHTGYLSEEVSVASEFAGIYQPIAANLNVTLPMITAEIFGGNGGFLNVTLPMITAEIRGGAQLNVTLPMITASIAGKTGAVGSIDVILPMITASIAGKVETLGEINVTLPMILAHITGKTGEVGSINVTLPMITSNIQGFNDLTGDLNATLPMIKAYMVGTTARFTSCAVVLRFEEPV